MEWAECAKSGKQASADFQYGGAITQIALLGNIAIRHKKQLLRFNAKKEKFINSETANAMFQRSYRDGWTLPS
jgi:Oxidoreductase family, C-terminal alpha/beta domain